MAFARAEKPRENANVARAKKKEKTQTEQLWDAYFAAQLTPEQKAAAHAQAARKANKARSEGVYERALEIVGTVKWSIPWQDLRLDE